MMLEFGNVGSLHTMSTRGPIDDPRRSFLVRALAAGLFTAGGIATATNARAGLFGSTPALPAGKSIYKFKGSVTVNGEPATLATSIGPSDTVATGPGSEIIFVVGDSAFVLRADSEMTIEPESSTLVKSLRLVTGALLSVFGRSKPELHTAVATIGIRGTGIYLESEPEVSYVCTCYGVANLVSNADPNVSETIVSQHHDAPRYILANPQGGQLIQPAPFKNHDDEELALIEALVGREPPFAMFGDGYGAPADRITEPPSPCQWPVRR